MKVLETFDSLAAPFRAALISWSLGNVARAAILSSPRGSKCVWLYPADLVLWSVRAGGRNVRKSMTRLELADKMRGTP